MRTHLTLVLAALALACGRTKTDSAQAAARTAPPPGESAVDKPHVVFTAAEVILDRVGEPVPAPVTVPSRPSPATLVSDAPDIVSIDDHGRLLAHAAGVAVVSTIQGPDARLRVTVVAPKSISIRPAVLNLAAGEGAELLVLDEGGKAIPSEIVRWETSGPEPVVLRVGRLRSPSAPGTYRLTARVGAAQAAVTVNVSTSQGAGRLSVKPARIAARKGQVLTLRAFEGPRPVMAEWVSRDSRAVKMLGQGLFQAVSVGRARACARVDGLEACSYVEVKP